MVVATFFLLGVLYSVLGVQWFNKTASDSNSLSRLLERCGLCKKRQAKFL
jgi:hypothetical protein